MVYTVTQHCRQTVIDMVEEEWQGEEKEEKGELRGRPSLESMETTVQRVGERIFKIVHVMRNMS